MELKFTFSRGLELKFNSSKLLYVVLLPGGSQQGALGADPFLNCIHVSEQEAGSHGLLHSCFG